MSTKSRRAFNGAPSLPNHTADPDLRPGFFYVTAIRSDGAWVPLLGPFKTHLDALAKVDEARGKAMEVDDRAPWYSYGTSRFEDHIGPGRLNGLIPMQVLQ